jgi:hypothetical protein
MSVGLLEAALQATLTCDAISPRFQLAPYGSPAPDTMEDPAIARGLRCTPATLVTSVWVVNVMRTIAKRLDSRLLATIGIAAVSRQPVLGFSDDDAARYQMLQSQQPLLTCIPLVRAALLAHRWCCRVAGDHCCTRTCGRLCQAAMFCAFCTLVNLDSCMTRRRVHTDLVLALQPGERPAGVAVGHER